MTCGRRSRFAAPLLVLLALLCAVCTFAGSAQADEFPVGYSVDVGYSGFSASGELGGSGRMEGGGGSEAAKECAPNSEAGPFSEGFYPPHNCEQVGRPFASPEHRILFTGNENCAEAGHPDSGATITWIVQLPHTGYWHVEVRVPNWTQYGRQDVYQSRSADGMSETVIDEQTDYGRWVTSAFGPHRYTEGTEYTVQLVPGHDFHCFYDPADQVRWVYDGPSSPAAMIASPSGGGVYPEGALVHTSFSCTPAFSEPLESCTDSNGASDDSGTLSTSGVGKHTYTVTARGASGGSGTAEISYSVVPVKVSCATNSAKLSLSPGLTDEPAVQTIKVKGKLTGCSGSSFTSGKYAATLRTATAVACEALTGAGAAASGTVSMVWAPKAKEFRSAGSFSAPLTETPEIELGGTLESGPFSPGTIYGTVSETFTGSSSCGVAVRGKVKPVKKATLTGTRFVVY